MFNKRHAPVVQTIGVLCANLFLYLKTRIYLIMYNIYITITIIYVIFGCTGTSLYPYIYNYNYNLFQSCLYT